MAGRGNQGNVAFINYREPPPINFQCPLLTSSNYNSWSIKMESIMDAQGIWDAVDREAGQEVDTKIVKRARAFILQALPEDILLQVASHKEASELWNALKTRFLGADRVQKAKLQTLNRDLELLTMKETDSIDDLAGKITELTSKIQALGSEVKSATQVKKLLNAVPDRFLPIVASIEQYSDLETMPFEEAIGRLKTYEERVKPKEATKNQSSQLLLTKAEWEDKYRTENGHSARGKGTGRSRFRGRGKTGTSYGRGSQNTNRRKFDKEDKSRNQEGKRDRRNLRCYNCDKLGHFSAECKAPKRNEEEINFVKDEEEPTLLIAMCSHSDMVMLNEEKIHSQMLESDESDKDV